MSIKKMLSILLAVLLVASMFAGCAKTDTPSTPSADPGVSTPAPDSSSDAGASEEDSPYNFAAGKYETDENGLALDFYDYELPLTTTDEVLTFWNMCWTPQYIPAEGFGSMPYQAELAEMTGVHIEYICPPVESLRENFAVLLAADDLADIMSHGIIYYGKSPEDAINEEWFINLLDYKEYAPNYFYAVEYIDQDTLRNTVYYNDEICGWFYGIYKDPTPTTGWCVREDFLEDLGLTWEDIVTYDDIHDMLFRFKNELGVDWPMEFFQSLEMVPGYFASGYNTALFLNSAGMPYTRVVDGKIQYTSTTEDDKNLIERMASWYKEGLIDPGWPGYLGNDDMMNYITTGGTAYVSMTPSQINDYIVATDDPDARWTSLTRPLLHEGQQLKYGQTLSYLTNGTSSIAASCENIPLAVTWCDWFYSPFGSDYSSWGPQGIVWEYDENGEKALTDFMLNNPDGMGAQWALLMYSANNLGDATYFSQARSYAYPGGRELLEMTERWVIDGYEGEYDVPTGFRLTDEQNEAVNELTGDVATYINEHYSAFFVGDKPISEWDAYVQGAYDLGMDAILDIYQDAYDAYMAA